MNRLIKIAAPIALITLALPRLHAQDSLSINKLQYQTAPRAYGLFGYDPNNQIDVVDLGRSFLKGHKSTRIDTTKQKPGKLHISVLPVAGYTLQTGFAGVLSSNFAFFTGENSNLSNVLSSIAYTQYQQVIFPVQANIWTKENKYNIQTDWRYLQYPSLTYGLGGNSNADSGYNIDYGYLKLHQAILRSVTRDLYLGIGYDFDYFWDVEEIDPPAGKPTDFERYGLSNTEQASGISLHGQFDNRRNAINPENATYVNATYRDNLKWLGSDDNWQSLLLDAREYIRMPGSTRNVLAFWSYDWLTVGHGNPPYLLLPSTGWDAYSNTGRGYIQGRFRSKNMLYLETEYRFGITPNGLFGGVVFANAQSFSDPVTGQFNTIAPGYGAGLRISLNKFSRTNLCIDYGWGTQGSGGFFVNLGEVF